MVTYITRFLKIDYLSNYLLYQTIIRIVLVFVTKCKNNVDRCLQSQKMVSYYYGTWFLEPNPKLTKTN